MFEVRTELTVILGTVTEAAALVAAFRLPRSNQRIVKRGTTELG